VHPGRRLGVCLVLYTLAACGGGDLDAIVPVPIAVEVVRPYQVNEVIAATGQLVAVDEATLAAEVSGQITRTLVEEGDRVAPDQILIEIDTEKRELELASRRARAVEARASLDEAKREATRIRTLYEQNVASKTRLDEVETQLRLTRSRVSAAEAELGLAERALRDASLRAPFGGWIAQRHVSKGDFVSQGTQLVDLVALDPVKVEFHLAERDSGRVELGAEVAVRVAPYPDEDFMARVTAIAPRIDARTRTLRVRARIPNPDARLRPGLFARANLGVEERSGVPMIPEEAILQRADGQVAYRLLDGNRVERVQLQTGVVEDGRVEIVAGLALGDQVVVRGQAQLFDDSVVSVYDAEGNPVVPHVADGRGDRSQGG
jgi:membrane fusion protein (multidrug efflux system)